MDAMAVLGIVEESDAKVRLGQIEEAMGRRLEHGRVPGGVGVGRTGDDAIGALGRGVAGAGVYGRERPQENAAIVPVERGFDVEAAGTCRKAQHLRNGRRAETANQPDGDAVRALLNDLQALKIGDLLAALGIIALDVPGVPVARLVYRIGHQSVAVTIECFAAGRLVQDRGDGSIGGECHAEHVVFKMRPADGQRTGRLQAVSVDDGDGERRQGLR